MLTKSFKIWEENNLLGDTSTVILTGKRNKAVCLLRMTLIQIIDYGRADVTHNNESKVVLEFLDFYKLDRKNNASLKYIIFDSKFTNYENLNKLDDAKVKFITIRRRGKNIVESINKIEKKDWKTFREQ